MHKGVRSLYILDRETLAAEQRFGQLILAGAYGFTVTCERDSKRALAILDSWRPCSEYLVACEAPANVRDDARALCEWADAVRSRVVHRCIGIFASA
jgi:hypothetical protein